MALFRVKINPARTNKQTTPHTHTYTNSLKKKHKIRSEWVLGGETLRIGKSEKRKIKI